jgi:CheY-like chemotaxis protein
MSEPQKDTIDVLVIDDSDIARLSMVRALRAAGLSVADLPSPIGATRECVRQGIRLVVLDINMPGLRGDKLAMLFRNSERLRDLKLVIVSGTSLEELNTIAKDVKADGVVPKAEGNEALVSTVKRLLTVET